MHGSSNCMIISLKLSTEREKTIWRFIFDSLSREGDEGSRSLLTISVVQADWIEKLRLWCKQNHITEDSVTSESQETWAMLSMLKNMGSSTTKSPSMYWLSIMTHQQGGYSRYEKSLHRLNQVVHWPRMGRDIKHFVRSCDTCDVKRIRVRKQQIK